MGIRFLLSWMALVISAPALGSNLIPVLDSADGRCSKAWGCETHEWKVEGLPGVHVVAVENSQVTFVRIDARGKTTLLIDAIPIVRNADGSPGWGTSDLLVSLPSQTERNGIRIWVAFVDDYADDAFSCHPKRQRRMAQVLFATKDGYRGSPTTGERFELMSFNTLLAEARHAGAFTKSRLVCRDDCCLFSAPQDDAPNP
jgi:hypothetical protein